MTNFELRDLIKAEADRLKDSRRARWEYYRRRPMNWVANINDLVITRTLRHPDRAYIRADYLVEYSRESGLGAVCCFAGDDFRVDSDTALELLKRNAADGYLKILKGDTPIGS